MVHCDIAMEGWNYKEAFVIQLSPETDLKAGQIAGRVEHVTSSRSSRFHSVEELLLFIDRILTDRMQTSNPPT